MAMLFLAAQKQLRTFPDMEEKLGTRFSQPEISDRLKESNIKPNSISSIEKKIEATKGMTLKLFFILFVFYIIKKF